MRPADVLAPDGEALDGTALGRTALDETEEIAADATEEIALDEMPFDPGATVAALAAQPAVTATINEANPVIGIRPTHTRIIGTTRSVDASSPHSRSQPCHRLVVVGTITSTGSARSHTRDRPHRLGTDHPVRRRFVLDE
jgi:hypothetical protein